MTCTICGKQGETNDNWEREDICDDCGKLTCVECGYELKECYTATTYDGENFCDDCYNEVRRLKRLADREASREVPWSPSPDYRR